MAFYLEEEGVWKCPTHPSKRRRSGICPICLRDRLVTLCPDCANVRPCSCCATATASCSSSSSSSFSLFSSTRGNSARSANAGVGRVSNLIDSEPAFRRSRSVAIPFLRSRFDGDREMNSNDRNPLPPGSCTKSSFWSVFKPRKSKKGEEERESEESKRNDVVLDDDYTRRMMLRSRSVSVPVASDSGGRDFRPSSAAKGRSWYFPSPMKAFRHYKTSKVVQERSPLYRAAWYLTSFHLYLSTKNISNKRLGRKKRPVAQSFCREKGKRWNCVVRANNKDDLQLFQSFCMGYDVDHSF